MEDDCILSIELNNSVILQTFRWIQIFASICSIILVLYICIHHLSRTILDRVSIIIARTIYLSILAYSFGFGVVQILCLFRMIAASISPAFVLLHVSFTVQQALSTFRYPLKVQRIVATLCIFISNVYAIFYGYFVFHEEILSGKTQFCSSFTLIKEDLIIINLAIMITLDIVNFIFTILLVAYNKKILKNERISFDLSRTFQRMQNVYAIEPFLPVFSLHSIVHIVHVGLYSYTIYNRQYFSHAEFTILHSVVNLAPFYCLIAPLAFLIVIKLGRFVRKGRMRTMISPTSRSNIQEVCFKNLKDAWDSPNCE
ncbi:sra-13 [Pristionchus pacificus]|uniref:G protein-coupled receptor n=1 Tax=Pristionchus pacificus TaxID=54126 RepID=A0A2A6BQL0_PRIPA|nr:sra-13 [Pristionchus pacificus]|eukprot:PDM68204.1 G protein-coupled receptor [Pristionchus pacificus]